VVLPIQQNCCSDYLVYEKSTVFEAVQKGLDARYAWFDKLTMTAIAFEQALSLPKC
jgi:hypothetical protein